MLSTFPSPDKDPKYSFPNSFGIPDNIFTAIVRQSQAQINEAVEEINSDISGSSVLADAATIDTDASLGINFYVTLGGNRTMGAPTNPSDWKVIRYYITQDVAGSRTLAWDAVFRFSTGIPSPTLTTTPKFSDYTEFMYNPTYATWDCIRVVKGFDTTTPP
jgi:hypothetical protein